MRTITGYLSGILLIRLICGLLTFVVLALTGVPFAAVIALLVATTQAWAARWFHSRGAGSGKGMSSDPGASARRSLERARETVQQIHKAAIRHRDPGLHQLADEVSEVALSLGHDAGPVQDWRPCPVCGAEPGSHCINKPGHELVNGMHPERTRL